MCTSLMYGAVWKNLAPAKCHYTKGQFIFVGTQTTLSVKSCEICTNIEIEIYLQIDSTNDSNSCTVHYAVSC